MPLTLTQIIDAKTAVERIEARLAGMLESEVRGALMNAVQLLQEAVHFAVCLSDNKENRRSGAVNAVVGMRIESELVDRLLRACTPADPT